MIWTKIWLALAGPLALCLAGAGLAAWIPEIRRQPALARLAHAFLLGAAATGVLSYLLSWSVGVPLDRRLFVAVAMIGGIAALARRRVARREAAIRARRWRWPELVVIGILAVLTLGLLAESIHDPVLDFDGRMTWGTQARFVRHDRSVLPDALTDERVFVVHPRYPLLLPILQVVAVEVPAVTWDEGVVRFLYALFLPALGLVLLGGCRPALGSRAAAIAVAAILFAPAISWGLEGGARSSYSDLPLAAFLGAALLLVGRSRLSRPGGLAAGLLVAAAVLTKQEGAILAGALVVGAGLGLVGRRLRASSAGWIAAACYLGALVFWLGWRREIPNRNDEAYLESLLEVPVLESLPDRATGIVRAVLESVSRLDLWGLLAPLLIVAAVALSRDWRRTRLGRLALFMLALQMAMVAAAYGSAPDLGVVGSTFGRFLVQAAAPLAILLALSTRAALRRATVTT